jgi:hypothetical protein
MEDKRQNGHWKSSAIRNRAAATNRFRAPVDTEWMTVDDDCDDKSVKREREREIGSR